MKRFCVACGRETDSLIDSLCAQCYLEGKEVLAIPKNIALDYDWRSEKVRVGRLWLENNDESLKSVVADTVTALAKPKRMQISGLEVTIGRQNERAVAAVSFSALVEGVMLPVRSEINIILNKTISDASMKISSYYHEAIIQLRFNGKPTVEEVRSKLQELLAMISEHKKKIELSHAIDMKNVRGGVDILVGSAKAAKIVATKISRKYNVRPIYSNKMIGMNDNGTTKYRHTYCLKFETQKK